MPSRAPQLEPRLRFPQPNDRAFGPGKAELLRLISATGSIAQAAAQMKMSYNQAWILVGDMNQLFREPLVVSSRGGSTGGGASLTPMGAEVLARYTRMEAACLKATRRDWAALRGKLRS